MTSKPGKYGIENLLTLGSFHPGYWKTLRNLRAVVHPEVALEGSALHFNSYPFEPATVFPNGTVEVDQIVEVNLDNLSQVRLKGGDILFVSRPGKEALVTFINQNDVKIEHRLSVWSSLLDPFLDTWEEQEPIDRQFEWFAGLGLDRDTVNRRRREVAVAMMAYNFGTKLWEWADLNLYDALVAQRARLKRKAFEDFYCRAISLAAIDPLSSDYSLSTDNSIDSALFSVLIDWYPQGNDGSMNDFSKKRQMRSAQIERLSRKLIAELTSAYSEPHRRYHTLGHIENCLLELGKVWKYAIHLNELRWALLFHDAIYDPRRQDNETRSADWACKIMDELQRPEDEKARVREMILATTHSSEPLTPDEALLLDIDLSTLGADHATFDKYDRLIRAEYQWVSEHSYRQARAQVLESFVNRERLYHTAPYRQRCEGSARMNIGRALARLRAG